MATNKTFYGENHTYRDRSIATDGSKVVIGAPGIDGGSDAVYIYDIDGGNEVKITPPQMPVDSIVGRLPKGVFGHSVAIHDGKIVVGAPGYKDYSGAAYIFNKDGRFIKMLTPSNTGDTGFGFSVAIEKDIVIVGVYSERNDSDNKYPNGAVYRFDNNTSTERRIRESSRGFGYSVAIHNNEFVVGAPGDEEFDGSVYHYRARDKTVLSGEFTDRGNGFGHSVAIHDGNILVGAPAYKECIGKAYLFITPTSPLWPDIPNLGWVKNGVMKTEIRSPDETIDQCFGLSVAINRNTIAVTGSSNQGAAYLYQRTRLDTPYDKVPGLYGDIEVVLSVDDLLLSTFDWTALFDIGKPKPYRCSHIE